MAAIWHNGNWYGGGSNVEANPSATATGTLTKVGIDGTVYDVAGGIPASEKGAANGVAELDENGLVLSSQLPSYVDDVLEYASVSAFPATGESGKIYVALDTNLTYRWSGSAYVEISPSLALGETSSTAYRGDRGKTAYDHATESGRSGAKSAGLYKIGVTAQGHVASTSAVAKADLTALGVADQNDVDAIEADIEGFKTVTGEYITITDGAELPAKNYSITISPVQEGSGDPSPSNVRPIHGADEVGVRVNGINQWDEETELGWITPTGLDAASTSQFRTKNYIPVISGASYYIKYPSNSGNIVVSEYDSNKGFISQSYSSAGNTVLTVSSRTKYIRFYCASTYGVTYNNDISINYPSTDHDYHAYNGHSTTITLPSTVYGGRVEMGGSGESKYGIVDMGDLSWSYIAQSAGVTGFYCSVNDIVTGKDYAPVICSGYKTGGLQWGGINDGEIGCNLTSTGSTNQIIVKNSNYDNATTFKNAMAGIKICYELATPETLSVTPFPQTLLDGVNNVWAEMKENSVVIDNAQQSLSYQPQNIVGQLRQEIEAKPDSFAELSDTSFSNLANGQIPKWNSTSQKWENANESGGGGASSLAELSDTNISSPADGQILKYDNATSKWINAAEYSYTLPTASASTKGGIKVGDNLSMNGEVLSATLPAWTRLGNGMELGGTVELPASFNELLISVDDSFAGDQMAHKTSAIFLAVNADFPTSTTIFFPVLEVPMQHNGTLYWIALTGSVSNNKRIYTLTSGFQGVLVVPYYR